MPLCEHRQRNVRLNTVCLTDWNTVRLHGWVQQGAPCQITLPPPPGLVCILLPLQLPFCFWPPCFIPPFPHLPQFSLDLKAEMWPIDTTDGSPNLGGGGGGGEHGAREKSHRYTVTYIHFHTADWALCWGLRPIRSEGGVQASQWWRPLFTALWHCLHTVFYNNIEAKRMRQTERERKGQVWQASVRKKKAKGRVEARRTWTSINERRGGTTQLTDKNKWLLRPCLPSAFLVSNCRQMKANTS